MSEEVKPIYLKERDGEYGKFYSKNMGTKEEPNYLNASVLGDGKLSVKFNKETDTFEPKTNQFGIFYVVNVMDKTYFANTGESQYGPYLRLKEAPPKNDAPPARREEYGSRG